MARIYNYLLQLGGKPFTILHSLDGYDEISLTNDTKVITHEGERVMSPEQLGKRMVTPAISVAVVLLQAAGIFASILRGEESGHRMRLYWPMLPSHCTREVCQLR